MQKSSLRWPVFGVLALFLLVTAAFVFEVVVSAVSQQSAQPVATGALTADTYRERVMTLLQDANPENGAALVEKYACAACHRLGAVNKIAPPFVGIAERAATRRPPLTASAYIYESITDPLAFVVAGYQPIMPQNFATWLTDRELGDIMAYLLTADAN